MSSFAETKYSVGNIILVNLQMKSESGVENYIMPKSSLLEPWDSITYPVDIYPLKFNNRNTRTKCEICSKINKDNTDTRTTLVFLL